MVAADVAPTGIWWIDLLIYLAALITTLTTIWKKFLKPAWPQVKRVWAALVALDDIAHEFKPNGGHSLRDSIDRLEATSAAHARKLDSLDTFARSELAKVAQRSEERGQQVAHVGEVVEHIAARGKQHRKDDPPERNP